MGKRAFVKLQLLLVQIKLEALKHCKIPGLENVTFAKTTAFACADEFGNTQTLKNAIVGKIRFSEIVVFPYANEINISQNIDISYVFALHIAKIKPKASFSLHWGAFRGLAKSLWVQTPFSPTAADPPGSLSDDGLGGGFLSMLPWGHFLNHFGVKFVSYWGPSERSGSAQMLAK